MPSHTAEERSKKRRREELERKNARIREGAEARTEKRATQTPSSQGTVNIQEREKIARERSERAGLAPQGSIKRAETPAEIEVVKQVERKKEGIEFLEEREFSKETRPERVQLDVPKREGAERLAIIGPSLAATALSPLFTAGGPFNKEDFGIENDAHFQTLIQDPETARELALQAIQQQVIDDMTTGSEKVGSLIEALPIGGLVTKVAGELIESPRDNVDTIVREITTIGTTATNTREKVLTGKAGDPFKVIESLDTMEQRTFELEQRIKILSLESAELTADADALNVIEAQILDTKIRIFDAKGSASLAILEPATDSNVFLTLQRLLGDGT